MFELTALRKLNIAIAGIAALAWLALGSHTNAGAQDHVALLRYDRPPLPSARGNLMGLGTGDVVMMF
jgi:hypothetical protein